MVNNLLTVAWDEVCGPKRMPKCPFYFLRMDIWHYI